MWRESIPPFVPHPWLGGPHRQTIAGAYLWRRRPYDAVPHTVQLADGDCLIVHEDIAKRPSTNRDVMLVHGLAGCHGSGYMTRAAEKLTTAGYRVFRLDLRGCGAGMALARRSLHAGRIGDVSAAARWIQQHSPRTPLTVVGFSLGASIVLKLLGSERSLPDNIDSAIAIAPPLDLQACSQNLVEGWNRMYDRTFVRLLSRYVDRRRRVVPAFDGASWPHRPESLYDFDRLFTAPLGGFKDVEDYYRRSSSLCDLRRITIPTRILFAKDDPLVPADVFDRAEFSPSTQVYATDSGGHLGFLGRSHHASPDSDWHWMDWRIVDWVGDFET